MRQARKKQLNVGYICDSLAEAVGQIFIDGEPHEVKSEGFLKEFARQNKNSCVIINSDDSIAELAERFGIPENRFIDSKCWVTERVYDLDHKKTIEVNYIRIEFAGTLDYSDEFNNIIKISNGFYKGTITLKGSSNKIVIKENNSFSNITLSLYNSNLTIGKNFVGTPGKPFLIDLRESNLTIGTDFSSNSNLNLTYGDYIFGDDVMLAKDVNIHSVSHQIGDADTGRAKSVGKVKGKIGNHVWIGSHVHLIGNFLISDGSIAGANSIVSQRFDEKNISIGGANKILKKNISWTRSAAYWGVDKIK
jgi:acetyltransferase-like isoleucine patch superfamily enzyme